MLRLAPLNSFVSCFSTRSPVSVSTRVFPFRGL